MPKFIHRRSDRNDKPKLAEGFQAAHRRSINSEVIVCLERSLQKPPRSSDELLAHAREAIPERAAVPTEVFIRTALPTTAVGKTFKPQLRYEAAQRVFSELLHAIAGPRAECAVSVGPDDRHGTRLCIQAKALVADTVELDREIRQALAGFSVHYQVDWIVK